MGMKTLVDITETKFLNVFTGRPYKQFKPIARRTNKSQNGREIKLYNIITL